MRDRPGSCHFPMALVIVTLAVCGCGRRTPAPPAEPAAQPIVPTATAIAAPDPPSDESLTSEEYIRLGMPAPDREWSGQDMLTAEKVLASLAEQGNRRLPRYQ